MALCERGWSVGMSEVVLGKLMGEMVATQYAQEAAFDCDCEI